MKQPIPFGKYYLLERVNVGGMAEVFKAKATGVEGFERLVAVKRILPGIAEDEEFITMFVDEAKIAVQLTHANIAQIFDLGRVEGSFFIALEYVSGKDLRAMWNRTRQRGELLPIPLSCYAIMKVCEGLDYAHNKHDSTGVFLNLVHRDVSPQNVLISYEGEVKIIDFGIAKAAGKVGRTQAGILKGKFGYMSPEQVLGLEIDRRSDVFGVGICLYELLTGERLFVAETDFATLEKVRSVDIMPPSTYNRRIPEELEQIVMRALARDRDLRYQTAMQLHDELQAFMHTSGNLFSRKDLSAYMHRVFSEEIEKESARDHEYTQMDPEAGSGESNDLAAFDTIDPVSTVSELSEQPSYPFVEALSAGNSGGLPEPRNRKATLLGIPAAAVVRAPAVPRLVPSPASVPPMSASRPPVALNDSGANMWDDDELSTQIYDKPDYDKTPLPGRNAQDGEDDGLDQLQASVPEGVVPLVEAYHPPSNGSARRAPRAQVATLQLPKQAQPTAAIPDPYTRKRGTQKGHPMLVAVFAVIAIIACIVLGLLLFGEREPATVNLSTTPTRVSVSVDGRALGTSSSPFVIGELSAGKRHDITISSPGYKAWSESVELKAGEVLSLPAVQLVRIDTGFALSSEPSGALVLVDGKQLPNATPVRVVDLAPGEHVVRLEKPGYAAWESPIHANPGTVLPLPNVSLQPLAANDAPAEPPPRPSWSSTHSWHRSSSSSSHGNTSSNNAEPSASSDEPSIPAAAREEPVASSAPAPSKHEEPENEPAQRVAAPAAHGGGTGKLRVNSRPWSQVFVDGKSYGPTPRMNIELPEGSHTLKLVNDEFSVTKTVEVNITAGKTETVVLNLAE